MPFKSTLAKSAGKLFGVFNQRDVDLRGAGLSSRMPPPPPAEIAVTGEDSTNTSPTHTYVTWIAPGSFVVSVSPAGVDYLLVGGGGEGARQNGPGTSGNASTALGLTSYGGGCGAGYNGGDGENGGSGGGGGGNGGAGGSGNMITGPTGSPAPIPAALQPQGNPGGTAPAIYGGAGGGGAGAAGSPAPTNTTWTQGGAGAVAMSGDANFPTSYGTAGPTPGRWFAAGGGGSGGNPNGSAPAQPIGGGGKGANSDPNGPTTHGIANTGSGGGGYTSGYGGGSGGGGAGGFLSSSMGIVVGSYSITIGSGGVGSPAPVRAGGNGADGIFVLRVPSVIVVT